MKEHAMDKHTSQNAGTDRNTKPTSMALWWSEKHASGWARRLRTGWAEMKTNNAWEEALPHVRHGWDSARKGNKS